MFKIVVILLIILTIHLTPFVSEVLAIDNCENEQSVNIKYTPIVNSQPATAFLENSGNLTIRFTIQSDGTLNTLKGKEVRLHFGTGPLSYNTDPTAVSSNVFELVIPSDKAQAQRSNKQEAELDWKPPSSSDFTSFCSGVIYRVGAPAAKCQIDQSLDKEAQPASTIPAIKFIGRTNTEYHLGGLSVTTDNQGQGAFQNVAVTGKTGEVFKVHISSAGAGGPCDANIDIKSTASPPSQPAPGPVLPGPAITSLIGVPPPPPCKDAKDPTLTPADSICTTSGGQKLAECTDNPNNPAIATAIGCVHTKPAEFIKDFLTFFIAIAGGLAFLMMLLGAFQMLTSAGNPETLAAGRDRLTSAIIGLLFVVFAVLLLKIIGFDILGLPGLG